LHAIVRSREHSKPEGTLAMRPNIALLHGLIALVFPLSFAQSHDHPSDNVPPHTRLGSVSFEISCHPKVQQDFNHGIALLHSFWHNEAEGAFGKVAAADPQCAIAYWGEAMTHFHLYLGETSPADLLAGNEALNNADKATEKSSREIAYIRALHALYDGYKPDGKYTNFKLYAYAMETVSASYPHDLEAKVFYALALLAASPPDDVSLALTRKATEILNPLLHEYPDHPGIAHYLVHACDNPEMAQQGLEAARQYARIAPASPHALHMPSHIFARLGLWQEDIRSNLASQVAAENIILTNVGAENLLHAMEFLEYGYLQIGHDDEARAIIVASRTINAAKVDPRYASYYPIVEARFPVLYAIETRDWVSAAHLEQPIYDEGTGQQLTLLAHAIAAGHLHDVSMADAAVHDMDLLMVKRSKGRPVPKSGTQAATIPDEVLAWAAFARGNWDTAVDLLRPIADRQTKVGKGEVELPAREMLAEIQLLSGHPSDGFREYQISLKSDPNRFNALLGAADAALQSGQRAPAFTYYRKLLKNCSGATGPALAELDRVRATLLTSPSRRLQ
jgi:hypothetical protein